MNARVRLAAVIRKESLQILRDPSSLAIAFVLPLVLLLLFGYGVSMDARNIPVGLVIEQNDAATQGLAGSFEHSEYFRPVYFQAVQAAEQALARREIDGIVWLKGDFGKRLLDGSEAPIAVRVNGVDSNQANLTQGYIQGVWLAWLGNYAAARGQPLSMPVTLEQRVWFNPALSSRWFLVPGLVAIIMTLIGSMLTAMVVAREWERGTMEAILVTPLRRVDLLLGKVLPYFILGILGMGLSVVVGITLFQVPFRGSVGALLLLSSLFMLASLGFGLFISAAIRIQFVAAQISIMAGFLPALFLSGLIFDLESTPRFIQIISHVVPARYFVDISHTLFMAGDVWPVLLPNALALAVMAVLFISLAFRKITKRLEG